MKNKLVKSLDLETELSVQQYSSFQQEISWGKHHYCLSDIEDE